MKRPRRLLAHPGFLALLCALGIFLFYWPFLLYPGPWRQPHAAVYYFAAWMALIIMIFLVSRAYRPRQGRERDYPPDAPGGRE